MTHSQLQAQRAALQAALFQGVFTVRAGDKSVICKSSAKMCETLAALKEKIRSMTREAIFDALEDIASPETVKSLWTEFFEARPTQTKTSGNR